MDWALVMAGFVLLMTGGEVVVQGAVVIAKRMRVPPLLIGFTIVAIGTSLPSWRSLWRQLLEINQIWLLAVLGSNVANVMLVLGTASMLGAV